MDVSHSAVLKQKSHHSPASIDPVVAWRLADILKPRQRDSLFIVNPQIEKIAEKGSSIQIDVRLYGAKTQIFLQVAADGTVNGTSECTSRHGKCRSRKWRFYYTKFKCRELWQAFHYTTWISGLGKVEQSSPSLNAFGAAMPRLDIKSLLDNNSNCYSVVDHKRRFYSFILLYAVFTLCVYTF